MEIIKNLLEAGVHFGHKTEKCNPKMAEYILYERNGIHIIDLQKSANKLKEACRAVGEIISNGGKMLFVSVKDDDTLNAAIREEASRCGMQYTDGGLQDGMLERAFTGGRGVLFVLGADNECAVIQEARNLGIPVVAIADTNCDPDVADYVIPGNDDAVKAVKYITGMLADAVIGAIAG